MKRTLVAFFDDDWSALRAAKDLLDVGLDRGGVRVLGEPDAEGLADLGLSAPDAERCAERLRAGGAAVAATTDEDRADGAREILDRDGVVAIQSQRASV